MQSTGQISASAPPPVPCDGANLSAPATCPACRTEGNPPPLRDGSRNDNPADIGFRQLIAEDYRTHDSSIFEPGFWAVALHRLANWRMNIRSRVVRSPITLLCVMMRYWIDWFWGIHLCHNTTRLGRRVRIWHHGATFLSARYIGNDVHIRHSTTFGLVSRSQPYDKPVIEDRVDVGVGVCILGDVTVGHDSVIGANSVVVRDVPPHSTYFGVPARPVNLKPASPPATP